MNLEHYTKTAQKTAEKNPEIEDIIIYGSAMKGKRNPQDIDIIIIFKNNINKETEYEFRKQLNDEKTEVTSTTTKQLQEEEYIGAEGIYLEGYSLIKEKPKAEEIHMTSKAIITYNTKKLTPTKKTQLHHTLYGRTKNTGILQQLQGKKLANNTITINYNQIEEIEEVLKNNNIEHTTTPILIPKRLQNKF